MSNSKVFVMSLTAIEGDLDSFIQKLQDAKKHIESKRKELDLEGNKALEIVGLEEDKDGNPLLMTSLVPTGLQWEDK